MLMLGRRLLHTGIRGGDDQPELSSETPHIGISLGGVDLAKVLGLLAIVNHAGRSQSGHWWDVDIGYGDLLPR